MASIESEPAASAGFTNEPDFKLGDWWVRPQRNELERGDQVAHVEARSMEVLVCLARHAPRVVGKQRLLDEVWSESAFVGEEVISHAIWELRKALGDDAREPFYIKTVPRKGYVLLAEIVRPRGSALPIEGARIDHYDILEELGRGSMGVVYKAFDRRLERTVAIKFLAPELTRDQGACRRFRREARLAAALDHPNLATVHAIGETSEGQLYLVTPFYAGGSLKEQCARGTLSIAAAVGFARQLARGLAAAHAQGIVHRDVKPANLLIDEHGTLKIADFGIAKLLGATDLTRSGVSLGTPAYKSPEQARGQGVDHRSDIWSFGVVLFEMLTGRRPFDGEYEQAVIHSILTVDRAAETDQRGAPVPEALRRIVAKAMAKEPGERYQKAEEVGWELDSLDGAGLGSSARSGPPVLPTRVRSAGLRGRWRIGLAALLLLSLAVGYSAWNLTATDGPPREVRYALAQASDLWVRGNDRTNLSEVRRQMAEVVDRAPEWAEGLGLYAAFLADAYTVDRTFVERTEIERLIQSARRLDPKSAASWAAEARMRSLDGGEDAYEKAAAKARRAVELEPSCGHGENCDLGYAWLAEMLWSLGRSEEAMETLESGMSQGNGHVRCRLKRAQLYRAGGEPEKAILDYKEVLKLDSTQSTALNDLGMLYLVRREFEEAASLFFQAFQRTGDPRAMLNRGNALYELRRWQDAIEAYQKAIELYPLFGLRIAVPALALGDVYAELGDVARARESYQAALEVFDELVAKPDPALRDRGQRAVCMAKLGRLDEAEREIESLLPDQETDSRLLIYAARVAALAGDREALFDRARRAIDAGLPPFELTNDAAFILFRDEREYLALLERRPMPSR